MKLFQHLHTINTHRRLVRKYCFKCGLYYQGLTHDLSKYSPTEFVVGIRYYQGVRSPNVAERRDTGYSSAWIHHKGRNKHHYEYWTDYSEITNYYLQPVKMPKKYFVEMICDRIAASRVYKKDEYTDAASYEYFMDRDKKEFMHPETYEETERVLKMLIDEGEEKTLYYLKNVYLKEKEK